MTDTIPHQTATAAEVARLREQVLDLGHAVAALTGQVSTLRALSVAASKVGSVMAGVYVAEGLPVPPELAGFAPAPVRLPGGPQLHLVPGGVR